MKNHTLLVLALILVSLNSIAEKRDSVKVVNFRVINASSGVSVELAHVINKTRREVAIADKLGYFKIPILTGDTLSITSLGYFSQIILDWGQFGCDSTFYTIEMKPRSYQLKEVKVSWFSNYDKFLKGVSELQIPLTKEEVALGKITEYFDRAIRKLNLIDLPSAASGAAFGKDWLAKQNEKLDEKLEKERKRRAIERKYSAGIVSALTGLTGNEVHWFMEYCAFTEEYLLKASDYDIRTDVLNKYKIYHPDKPSKEK
ncbi:MAG: hypothetical protein HOO91_03060 [Bacteroidales bacterium]|nr:hypothetical protein [Bacteroidales bacterium]